MVLSFVMKKTGPTKLGKFGDFKLFAKKTL